MLTIHIKSVEAYDEEQNKFVHAIDTILELEHSLVSLSKWESEFERPFLGSTDKTDAETLGYVKAMTLTENVSPEVYNHLTPDQVKEISNYLNLKMSATWFAATPPGTPGNKEIITAEVIYYWMVSLNIPFETQFWHLNRLITLVKVCNEKNKPADKKPKMSRSDLAAQRRQLNEQRKQQMNSQG